MRLTRPESLYVRSYASASRPSMMKPIEKPSSPSPLLSERKNELIRVREPRDRPDPQQSQPLLSPQRALLCDAARCRSRRSAGRYGDRDRSAPSVRRVSRHPPRGPCAATPPDRRDESARGG